MRWPSELTNGLIQQSFELEQRDELVERSSIARGIYAVNVAEKIEAVDDGKVPPELRALSEDDADSRDVFTPVVEGDETVDLYPAGVGAEDSRQDLDRRGFAGAVGADESQQLAFIEREGDAFERFDFAIARGARGLLMVPKKPGARSEMR